MAYKSLYSNSTSELDIRGSVVNSAALPSSGQSNGWVYVTEDTGHTWFYTGSVSVGAINGFIDLGPVAVEVLPLPLYAITGATATVPPGETVLATYASMTALLAAVPPTAQGERIQVRGAPFASTVGVFEGRYIAGSWAWLEV